MTHSSPCIDDGNIRDDGITKTKPYLYEKQQALGEELMLQVAARNNTFFVRHH